MELVGQGSYRWLRMFIRREEIPGTADPPIHPTTKSTLLELSRYHWVYPDSKLALYPLVLLLSPQLIASLPLNSVKVNADCSGGIYCILVEREI